MAQINQLAIAQVVVGTAIDQSRFVAMGLDFGQIILITVVFSQELVFILFNVFA